ncbi:MAG: tetratricopeptide repeat protein [Terriglobia bacterium]
MRMKYALLMVVVLVLSSALYAQGPSAPVPMTEKEVMKELKSQGPAQLIKDVSQRGTDFDMNPDTEKKLRKANATDEVVKAVASAGPKARAAAKAAGLGVTGGQVLTAEEGKDFLAIRNELDPDKAITLVEDFAKKYPNSPVLSYAYSFEANANQQKGDVAKVVAFCQKSLELKKDNLMSLIMIVSVMPQPQYLKDHEADKEKQLALAENYAQDALKQIDELKKQGEEADADFAKRKGEYAAGLHGALGMVHLDRSEMGLAGPDKDELVKAEQEYTTAVTTTDRPDSRDYYRLGEAYNIDGKIDEAIAAFTKAAELGQGTMIKQYADKQIEALNARKGQSATPAKP